MDAILGSCPEFVEDRHGLADYVTGGKGCSLATYAAALRGAVACREEAAKERGWQVALALGFAPEDEWVH